MPCRAVVFQVSKPLAFHLNEFRFLSDPTDPRRVPRPGMYGYFKNAVAPSVEEGLVRVDERPFEVDAAMPKDRLALLKQHLLP